MRALALLAAIAVMHTTHALPRHDLTVRQGENDLSNDSHVFHHLDRNQRTANRDRNRTHGDSADGSGLYVVKRLPERPPRDGGWMMARGRDRRFMQSPDYSQDGSRGGSNSASPASNTMPTQQPPAKAETPGEGNNSHE
ncbi:hypothetical protein J3R82DRAFT_10872 [Butyriboletus roseoflavus]|nr:hypothetical protein J3R82DRAFT_10872 [Butyriboletus roseoflavus]